MLVLTRREDQRILFPSLGITIEVVGIRGRNVKIGVDAPPSIRIVRDELLEEYEAEWGLAELEEPIAEAPFDDDARVARHQLNNRLNALSLRLQIAEKLIARGESDRGLDELQVVLDELSSLETTNSPSQFDRNTLPPETAADLRIKVLLVEDNENERQLLSTILKMADVSVISVANGEEALDYLEQNDSPDLILIDMQMPRMNGPQTISVLRNDQRYSDLPIYGVSGSCRSELNIPINDRGVNGWFAKPVQAEKLLDRIFRDCGIEGQQVVG